MQRWAEVRANGRVQVVLDWQEAIPPAFHSDVGQAIQVTGMDPEPGPGWNWDGETFSPPAE